MGKTLSWIIKRLLLPLLPFFIGVLIRTILQVSFKCHIIDPAELSFSMAMLCFFVSLSASKNRDKNIADTLSTIFMWFLVYFVILFTLSLIGRVYIENSLTEALQKVRNLLEVGGSKLDMLKILNSEEAEKYKSIIDVVRWFAIIPSIFVLVTSIICKYNYKLGD